MTKNKNGAPLPESAADTATKENSTINDQRPLYWPLTWRGTEHYDSPEHHAPKPSNTRQRGFIEPHLIGLLTLTAPAAGALAAIVTGALR